MKIGLDTGIWGMNQWHSDAQDADAGFDPRRAYCHPVYQKLRMKEKRCSPRISFKQRRGNGYFWRLSVHGAEVLVAV